MATYEEIYGKRVKELSTDPTLDSSYEGQVWYNSTSGVLKSVVTSFAFRSTTNLPAARNYGTGGGGTQTACWVAGGDLPPFTNETFNYDGSGWTASGNMGDARIRMALGNMGPQTAGLGVGGYSPGIVAGVEEYDGSTWTGGTSLPGALQQAGGAGPQTANIILGGGNPTTSLSYNGSSWSSEGSSSEAFAYYGLAGANSEAALAFYGAEGPPGTNRTTGEEYNGTSWTTVVGTLPNQGNSGGATGTVTSAIFAGNSTTVRSYDGTSITLEPAMSTARGNGYIGGTATNGITSGGSPNTAAAEEFDRSINVFTAAAWASSNNLNTGRNAGAGFGIQTAAVMTTGNVPPESNATEEYDGSSWTSVTNYPISKRFTAASGTLTSGLVAGGSPIVATVNKYDGTNWTAANSLPTSTDGGVMFGTQTASVYSVGRNPSATTTTYEFDGTNWTAGNAAGTARYFLASSGTLTAGLMFGGQAPGPSIKSETEEYDGTSWSESGDLGTGRYGVGGSSAGTQTDTIAFAGNNPAVVLTEGYDGTVWSTRPSMATARRFISGAGTATAALGFGGNPPNTSTEEFTGQVSTLNIADFTTS